MLKCGNKFCSNTEVKDTQKCRDSTKKRQPTWSGACFWQSVGAGCEECGAKVIRSGACVICTSCAWSPCG